MNDALARKIMQRQKDQYMAVKNKNDRGHSAQVLTEMALKHNSGSAQAAAELILAMEYDWPYELSRLLRFDSTNRAHADVVLQGFQSCEGRPSQWITDNGAEGVALVRQLYMDWGVNEGVRA